MTATQRSDVDGPRTPTTLDSVRVWIGELACNGEVSQRTLDTLFEAMRSIEPKADPKQHIDTLIDICVLADQVGRFPGHPLGAYTLDKARSSGDKNLLLRALRSSTALAARSPSGEVVIYAEAFKLARELPDPEAEFKVCLNIMVSLASLGQFATAQQVGWHAQGLQGIDDQLRVYLLSHMASLALLTDSPGTAKREIATAIAEVNLIDETQPSAVIDLNRRHLRCVLCANAARLAADLGDLLNARRYRQRLTDLAADDSTAVIAFCKESAAAALALAEGDVPEALARIGRARDLAKEQWGDLFYLASVSAVSAYEAAGRPEMALSVLREIIEYTQSQQEEVLRCDDVLRSLHLVEDRAPRDRGYFQLLEHAVQLEREVAERWNSLVQACINADAAAGYDLRRSFRLRKLATLFCRFLSWPDKETADVALGAQFANIGMVGLPSMLLMKTSELSDGERRLLQSHAPFGERLLQKAELKILTSASTVARHHHEQWRGGGYPDGLAGESIPVAARVVALCDAFDAMMHPRPWRHRPLSLDAAVAEISRVAGTQFDPALAADFTEFVRNDLVAIEDLDSFLGADGDESAYVRAREQIAAMITCPLAVA